MDKNLRLCYNQIRFHRMISIDAKEDADMNTRHAQMILTIVREGSITAAARALSITQPTLSQTVRQIETQLGEPIFLRGHASVRLTPAGELYVQAARRIIQAETQLAEAISLLRGRAEGTLRIGLLEHRSQELLPQVLPDFFSAYPGICLEVCESNNADIEQKLLSSEIDMALVSGESRHPKIEYRQIASEEIVLLAGKKTALAQRIPSGSTIGLREAEHERFVLPSSHVARRHYYTELLASCGIEPDIAMICDNIGAAKRTCAGCSLVMLAPFISLLSDSGSMQRLSHYHIGTDAYLPPFYMAYLKETPLAPHGETLFSMLSSRFRAMTAYRV